MNRGFASKRFSGDLAAAIRDHLIHVHVELRSAPRHPDVQRKHVVMPSVKDLITDSRDEMKAQIVQPITGVVGNGSGLFQRRVRRYHLARHQILADAEVLQRPLRLSSPEFIGRNLHFAEAVGLGPKGAALVRIHPYYAESVWSSNLRDGMRGLAFAKILLSNASFPGTTISKAF